MPDVEKSHSARVAGRRLVLLCGVAPAILTVALALYRPEFFVQLDYRVYDGMLRSLPMSPPGTRIAIVDVDDRSLSEIGQWPWRRDVMARLITRLRELGAAVVALDILFAESDRYDASSQTLGRSDPDAALAGALREGRVVLGYALTFNSADSRSGPCVLHALGLPIIQPRGGSAEAPVFRATGAICTLPALAQAAGASGFLNAVPDVDGILRRVPLVIDYDGRIYPGLALAAVMAATGAQVVALRAENVNATSLVLDNLVVPLDGRSNLLLRYRGGNRVFPYVSAADVLRDQPLAANLEGAVVFVGATALGTREVVSTPFDTLYAGVEVQATVADNLLRQEFMSRPADALTLEVAAVLILGIAITLLVARSGLSWGAVASGVALIAVWGGARWLLSLKGHYLSPVFPTVGLMASLTAATISKLVQERGRADRAAGEKDVARRLMVQSLLSLTEIRDVETGRHSRRTQLYSRLLAEQLCEHPRFREYLTPARIDLLANLAPLHDIGKVGVPDQLLNKPGALTAEEFQEMKKHAVYGLNVITTAERHAGSRDDVTLAMAKDIVYTHHERWDGNGYPRGLKGEQIPIPGRLIALVDVYDALTSRRLYRQPLPHDKAVEVIADGNGTHFDPAVVDAFLRTAPLLQNVAAHLADARSGQSTTGHQAVS